ncbi:hypothetical protein PPROV_001002800 [Pycnococcus provasolii]|uniref:Uncharacterized protein n=1 Tax=Pycnococcus provasolii TaxID=41880 RepID=A0A830HZP2_9CHLO|nr:hypothetical protein PPROV_001002800 [Pycnococcus provasolii]
MGFFTKLCNAVTGKGWRDGGSDDGGSDDDERQTNQTKGGRGRGASSARKGFKTKKAVSTTRAVAPVIEHDTATKGGVQGLAWVERGLVADDDGDVAEEHWDENGNRVTSVRRQ